VVAAGKGEGALPLQQHRPRLERIYRRAASVVVTRERQQRDQRLQNVVVGAKKKSDPSDVLEELFDLVAKAFVDPEELQRFLLVRPQLHERLPGPGFCGREAAAKRREDHRPRSEGELGEEGAFERRRCNALRLQPFLAALAQSEDNPRSGDEIPSLCLEWHKGHDPGRCANAHRPESRTNRRSIKCTIGGRSSPPGVC
jgi:hypothetical protein